MMSVPDTIRREIVYAKISKLLEQCRALAAEEYPYFQFPSSVSCPHFTD